MIQLALIKLSNFRVKAHDLIKVGLVGKHTVPQEPPATEPPGEIVIDMYRLREDTEFIGDIFNINGFTSFHTAIISRRQRERKQMFEEIIVFTSLSSRL